MRPTDELVKLAKSGDQRCIAELVDRFEATVVSTAWSITGDFHLAQDVAQESLVNAFRNLGQLRDDHAFVPWLLQSVRRNAFKVARRNSNDCLLYTSPSPRDRQKSRMPSSA